MDAENPVLKNIRSRRSVRSFKENPIPREIVEKIVEAGRFAPSALNRQPWKFIIIDNNEFIKELSRIATERIKSLYKLVPLLKFFNKDLRDPRMINTLKRTAESPHDTVFYNAPLIIFVANDTRFDNTIRDCHLAAQNMMLAAHSLGIGSCFIGRGQAIPKEIVLNKSKLPNFYDVNIHIAFGYPKEFPKTPPTRREDNIEWV